MGNMGRTSLSTEVERILLYLAGALEITDYLSSYLTIIFAPLCLERILLAGGLFQAEGCFFIKICKMFNSIYLYTGL